MCRRSGMLLRASYYLLLSLQDKLMTVTPDSSSGASSGNWLFKNKEHGKMSAAASLVSLHHFRLSILFSIWFCLIIYHHDHRVWFCFGMWMLDFLKLTNFCTAMITMLLLEHCWELVLSIVLSRMIVILWVFFLYCAERCNPFQFSELSSLFSGISTFNRIRWQRRCIHPYRCNNGVGHYVCRNSKWAGYHPSFLFLFVGLVDVRTMN